MRVPDRYRAGIIRCTPADADDLRAFQLRTFESGSREVDAARTAWLFDRNPCRTADGTRDIYVCRRDGEIVGQQAEIPFDLRVGGRDRRAAWTVDLMVDDEWRLRGVGPGRFVTNLLAALKVSALLIFIALGFSIGAVTSFVGAYISYFLDGATGGIIVVLQTALFLLAFAGIPLTSGFVGKLVVFSAAIDAGAVLLVIVGVVASAIAAFFYIRVIVLMFFTEPAPDGPTVAVPSLWTTVGIGLGVAATIILGIVPGPMLELAQQAATFVR